MLFDNLLLGLSPPELAAVLSVIIFERKSSKQVLNQRLKDLEKQMILIAQRINVVESKCGMDVDLDAKPEDLVYSGFMQVAYNWCKGIPFCDLMKDLDMDEGFVVNQLLRTETVARKLGAIAHEIGNPELQYHCEEISQAFLRDIIFTPSLYLMT